MKRLIVCDTIYNYIIAKMMSGDKEIAFVSSVYTTINQKEMLERIENDGALVLPSENQKKYISNIYVLSKLLRSMRKNQCCEVLYFPSGSCAHFLVELMIPNALAIEEGVGAYVEDGAAHKRIQQCLKFAIALLFSLRVRRIALFRPSARTPISFAFYPDKLLTPSRRKLEKLVINSEDLPRFGYSGQKVDILLLDTVVRDKERLLSETEILSKVSPYFKSKNVLLKRHPLHKCDGWHSRIANDYSDCVVNDVLVEEVLHENIVVAGFPSTALYFTKVVFPAAKVVMLITDNAEYEHAGVQMLAGIVDSIVML